MITHSMPGTGGPKPPAKGRRWKVVVALVLVIVLGGALYVWPGLPKVVPAATVRAYLQALASGDAATALSYAKTKPADTSLLTDEVLAVSNQRAPITDIWVNPFATDYGRVAASYRRGGQVINAVFDTSMVGGFWLLEEVAVKVWLGSDGKFKLNGVVAADNADAVVFPGSYTITPVSDYLRVERGDFVVNTPFTRVYEYPGYIDPAPRLSEAGTIAFRDAAKAELVTCLNSKTLDAFGDDIFRNSISEESNGETSAEAVKWTVVGGSFDDLVVKGVGWDGASATSRVLLRVTFKTADGKSHQVNTGISKVSASLSANGFNNVTFS
jgi:hypothetical protein